MEKLKLRDMFGLLSALTFVLSSFAAFSYAPFEVWEKLLAVVVTSMLLMVIFTLSELGEGINGAN